MHHATASFGKAAGNFDSYPTRLGCVIKKAVNFDHPSTCHLYYGDEVTPAPS
jgi:glyoxalase family protein